MPKPITIVAGFGRCGSSLVMQMLAAGGMPTPYSEYPSYEINFSNTQVLMQALQGGAIKVLDPHINRPPIGPEYRWIWLDRDPVQQAKSMAKLWKAATMEMAGVGPGAYREFTEDQIVKLAEAFKRDRPQANGLMLKYTPAQGILKLRFEMILAEPAFAAYSLNKFCGGKLDEAKMVAAVRPRTPECLPYLMEFEQMAEAEAREAPNG
jgi:hypothetical protein